MSVRALEEGYGGSRGQEAPAPGGGYVKEFTRHSGDVLLNLNELRLRDVLTDTTLVVGGVQLRAHCAVLVACSGFFYSLYSHRVLLPGAGGGGQLSTVSLPDSLDPACIALLLDFMYTSRLPLTPRSIPGVLSAATYLQMEHVADTCRDFLQLHWETRSLKHLHLELDSRGPPAAPRREDLAPPGPQRFTARAPPEAGVSLHPGVSPTCQPGAKGQKGEPESPLMGTPTPSPDSPGRSSCQPDSPAESNTCSTNPQSDMKPSPDPKACNWKKYKYIVLNPLCAAASVKEEEEEEPHRHASPEAPKEAWSGEVPGQIDRQGRASCYEGSGRAPPLWPHPSVDQSAVTSSHVEGTGTTPPIHRYPEPVSSRLTSCHPHTEASHVAEHAIKREPFYLPYCHPGNLQGGKSVCSGDKPYRCSVCGAQFNRPANLKTHTRIHSGEKPYRCDTCGARFVQVAHLRAHVLIHTGEKPYPCHTCGTRFRHLQTLKSHLRIHTGEKPYTCESCDLHFRHKSQLRLHLRQKHGAITNTKVRYQVLTEAPPPHLQPLLQAC
ncbi:B-cell CLL/lymphoma 6 member B protein isoform X2 [Antennarius striatus]|uniref:B-cell CLL/lymphoma 6 member B protein isoform X2 n=1 Tax=Antennarius striatus TaxID=241820 RepID=UPI0035B14354